MHIRHGQALATLRPWAIGDEKWFILKRLRRQAVAAPHECWVQRHDVEEGSETQLLLDESADGSPLGPGKTLVEEQLAGVVAWLAVNVHGAGEVGSQAIVEPVRIGEPGIRFGQDDQLSRSGMIEADFRTLRPGQDTRGSGHLADLIGDGLNHLFLSDINVGKLMIAHGEGSTRKRVEHLAKGARPDRQQIGLPEQAVEQDRPADVTVAVLADDPDARPAFLACSSSGSQAASSSTTSRGMSQWLGPKRWVS